MSDGAFGGKVDLTYNLRMKIWGRHAAFCFAFVAALPLAGAAPIGLRYNPRVAAFDLNQDGYLSADELDRMPIGEVRIVFSNAKIQEPIDAVFDALPVNKQVAVLSRWIKDINSAPPVLVRISRENPSRATQLLWNLKEPSHAMGLHGSLEGETAHLFLLQVPEELQRDLLGRLDGVDAAYAKNIRLRFDGKSSQVKPSVPLPPATKPIGAIAIRQTHRMPMVIQNEYLLTNAAIHPEIQTVAAGPCIILTLYDAQTKLGMIAHLDSATAIETELEFLRKEFLARGVPATRLEAGLFGGYPPSPEFPKGSQTEISTVKHWLGEWGITLKYENTSAEGGESRNVILDLRDGSPGFFDAVILFDQNRTAKKAAKLLEQMMSKRLHVHEDSLPPLSRNDCAQLLADI